MSTTLAPPDTARDWGTDELDDEPVHVYPGVSPDGMLHGGRVAFCGYRFPGPDRPARLVPLAGLCAACALLR